jgi:hypothetical protein
MDARLFLVVIVLLHQEVWRRPSCSLKRPSPQLLLVASLQDTKNHLLVGFAHCSLTWFRSIRHHWVHKQEYINPKEKKNSIQSLPLPQLVVVVVRRKRRAYLLVMRWRDALKEHFGNVRIDVSVNPPGPCSEPLSKSNQTIHVFLDCLSLLNVVPSETRARSLIS